MAEMGRTKAIPPAMAAPRRPPDTAFWKAADEPGAVGAGLGMVPLVLSEQKGQY